MPHEKNRSSLFSNACHFPLDRRRALTLSPEIKRDSFQTESPLKIPRRVPTAEDECVDTGTSKDRSRSNPKIHWTQFASNGTASQSDPKSQKNSDQEHTVWQEIRRRQVKVVLEDVLHTEIGQRLLRCGGQSFQKSESKRPSDRIAAAELKDKRRRSLIKRGETDSTGPKATPLSRNQTESSTENDSCPHKEIKNQESKQLSSSLKLLETSKVSSNSCSPRESDSPQADSEHLPNKKERRETQECPKHALEDTENHLLRNGEVVQEMDGTRGSVLRLSVGVEHVSNSDCASGTTEGRSYSTESSKPTPSEPIVLSSEEEEEGEEKEEVEASSLNIQPLDGAKDMNIEDKLVKHLSVIHTQCLTVVELQLSSLHMGGVSATCESMKVTTENITFSLKDCLKNISISTPNVCKYSVWDEPILSGCGLAKDSQVPPPSLVLFWLSDDQAQGLRNDLSLIRPGTCPAEGSTCVLLCLAEPVTGVESALLASLMDLVQIQSSSELLSLTQPDSLKELQSSQETHLLQLLTPETDPQTSAAAHAAGSAVKSQDSDVQLQPVYTLCHSRAQGSYSVTLAPALGAEWTPYRHCGPARRLIQFPPPPTKGAITVTTEDLECLDSGEFLNDVIIDFYLKYLLVEKAPQASVDRSHVFSSFFYKQLTRRDNANEDSTSTPAQVRRHQRVRTWTRHVDIFDKDFLFVPVNQEAHWYLVVICFPGLEVPRFVRRDGLEGDSVQGDGSEGLGESEAAVQEENRSNSDENKDDSHIKSNVSHLPNCTENTCKRPIVCKRPCILIMDSLKLSVHERIFKLLREYLQVEWHTKRGGHRDFSVEHMAGFHCTVPLQDNSSDCGLYLLQYAESFLQDPVVHFDLPLRLEHWFPRQQVRGKREEIRDLILHLYRFQQGHECSEDRTDHGNVIQ